MATPQSPGCSVIISSNLESYDREVYHRPSTPQPERPLWRSDMQGLPHSLPNSPTLGRRNWVSYHSMPRRMRPHALSANQRYQHQPPLPPPRNRSYSTQVVAFPDYSSQKQQRKRAESCVHRPLSMTQQELTLLELAQKPPSIFPVQVELINSYCSQTSKFSLMAEQRLNIHFVKHTDVITVRDGMGMQYLVPLNSAVKFGILFDAESEAMPQASNSTYAKVGDILALPKVPRVICAQRDVVKKRKVYVAKGQIFIVKGVGRSTLKCFSLPQYEDIDLGEDCKGHFTADAEKTKLYLSDLVQHLPNAFPCTAKIYPNHQVTSKRSTMQPGATVNLYGNAVLSSLIASTVDPDSNASQPLLNIPIDDALSSLAVRMIPALGLEEAQQLHQSTQLLKSKFDPSKFIMLKDASSDEAFELQNLLFQAVRPGSEANYDPYVEMVPISSVQPITSDPAFSPIPSAPEEFPDEQYETLQLQEEEYAVPPEEPLDTLQDNSRAEATPYVNPQSVEEENRRFVKSMNILQVCYHIWCHIT